MLEEELPVTKLKVQSRETQSVESGIPPHPYHPVPPEAWTRPCTRSCLDSGGVQRASSARTGNVNPFVSHRPPEPLIIWSTML